ncbi:MAG: hypothetical protein IJS59_07060 [Bacteroidaceae bacterium]|nr:hypothetical protein [Bacteroidaceae bacterium]
MALLLLAAVPVAASAQATFQASIDTVVMLIGQQRVLTFQVECSGEQRVQLPAFQQYQPLYGGVEVVEKLSSDTVRPDAARMVVTERWTITAFDSALVALPPFAAIVGNDTLRSQSLALKVVTVPVDTLHLDEFFPPKGVQDNPFSWADWNDLFWLAMVLTLIALVLAYVSLRAYQNKPIIRIIRRAAKRPPHQVAMEHIERLKVEKRWAEEDSKEYYTELTDALRTYIRDRYGFNAMEMTSTEIIGRLLKEQDEQALAELRQLFETADLVKFAKWTTLMNENDANLVSAIDFINQTKVEADPNAKPVEEVVTVEEKQSRERTLAMRITIAVLSVAAEAMLIYMIWRIIELLR